MFQRQHLTRITLAAAMLSAAVITLPAHAGLLGGGMGGSLTGAAAGRGNLGAHPVDLGGQGAGRLDAEAHRPAIIRPLRETAARGQAQAAGSASESQQRATVQTEGAASLAADRSQDVIGRAEGGATSSAGAAGKLMASQPPAAIKAQSQPSADEAASPQPAPNRTLAVSANGDQSSATAVRSGRAEAGTETSGNAQASREGNRVETRGSASAQASAKR